MKKILNLLALAAVLGTSTACTDILDTAPYDKLSSGTMWTTEESVDQGVIGVYYSLQRPFHGDKFIGANAMIGYYGYDALGMGRAGRIWNAELIYQIGKSQQWFLSENMAMDV